MEGMPTCDAEAHGTGASRTSLVELAVLFLRLGATAFGGPAAHIAMMRNEVVNRRMWMSDERFLDLLGATNLIPGPNSTEMAIHVGWDRWRWAGLLIAGVCFIVPAALLTGALAWAYVRFGTLPQATWLLWGVKPVILAIVVQALWKLAPTAAPNWRLRGLGVLAAAGAGGGHGATQRRRPYRRDVRWAPGRPLHRRGSSTVDPSSLRRRQPASEALEPDRSRERISRRERALPIVAAGVRSRRSHENQRTSDEARRLSSGSRTVLNVFRGRA